MQRVIYSLLFIIFLISANTFFAASASAEELMVDGKILFTAGESKKNIDHIYLLNGSSQQVTQLTQKGRNFEPKWSPDGKKIAFVSIRDNHNNFEIYIMDANGKNQRRITNTPGGNSINPRWDCSGSKIYFRTTIKGDLQENIIDLTTFEIRTLASTGKMPEVKPIKDISIYVEELRKKGEKEIEKELARVKKEEKALQKMMQERHNMFVYVPSPNCRYYALYYRLPGKIKLLDIKTNELKELKSHRSGQPSWSKDSNKLAYVNGENGDHFIIFSIDTNQYSEIKISKTEDEGCGGELSWSSDSRKFVYTCGTDYIADSSQIYILDLETKQAKAIINGDSPDWY